MGRSTAGLLGALATAGCATTSADLDLAQVHELSRAPLPALDDPSEEGAPGELSEEVRALLAHPLDANAAVRVALLNNRELRGALRDMGVERGQLVQAGLLPNPAFQFDVRQLLDNSGPLQVDVYLEVELTHALLTPLRTEVATADLEAARARAAAEVVGLGQRVRGGIVALQAAQRRLELAEQALDALAAGRDAARALFSAGNLPELDLATREVEYESARSEGAALELALLDRREALQVLLGLWGEETGWRLAGALEEAPSGPEPEPGDVEGLAVAASLRLREAKDRLTALAQRTNLARTTGWLPDISIDGHLQQDQASWELGGGATIGLPIFDRQQGNLASVEAQFDAGRERYWAAAVEVRSQARAARNRLTSAQARAAHCRQVVLPARARVLEQAQLQYNAMQLGVFALLAARRQQLDAELGCVDLVEEAAVARVALDAVLAGVSAGPEGMGAAGRARFSAGGAGDGGH